MRIINNNFYKESPMKKTNSRFFLILFFMITVLQASVRDANAYLDPGTGSLLLQVLIAGLLGVLFTVKMYWRKCKDYFKNLRVKKKLERE